MFLDRCLDGNIDDQENAYFIFETLAVPSNYEALPHVATNALPPSQTLENTLIDFYISTTKVFQSHKHLSHYMLSESNLSSAKKSICINETYMMTKDFALCAVRKGHRELYCVYDIAIPHYAIVAVTRDMFDLVQSKIQEK